MQQITVNQLRNGQVVREGAGVKLTRYIGADRHNDFEPFLLFDFFDSNDPMDYIGGFPAHPHRGFETITYLLQGKIRHQDNKGHEGVIGAGDVQWMTAGRGVIHSEMPMQEDEKRLTGLQLWLNLPAASKLCTPAYHEFTASQLPVEQHANGVIIKVIAGMTVNNTASPIIGIETAPLFFDIFIPTTQQCMQVIPATHQALIFVLSGELIIQQVRVPKATLAVLNLGEELVMQATSSDTRCLLIAAKKLHEPIARLGPFVMNSDEEIASALDDFRNNRF